MRYTGETCPVCNQVFQEDDDIVVCPDCGTPHHRKCYLKNKHCANEALHQSGFVWAPTAAPVPPAQPENTMPPIQSVPQAFGQQPPYGQPTDDGHKIVFCPNCGAQNPAEEPNCLNCGARLYNNPQYRSPYPPQVQLPDMTHRVFRAGPVPISPDDKIGENTVGDTAEFVQSGAARYIPKFYAMEKSGKKVSWNWAAFLFAPYWFFYRKLYAVGAVVLVLLTLASGLTSTPRVLEATDAANTTMEQFYAGELSAEEAQASYMETYKQLLSMPEVPAYFGITFALHLLSGLFANYLYLQKTKKDVKRLREECATQEEYRFKLFRRGGVSLLLCLLSIGIYYAASTLVSLAIFHLLS